MSHTLQYYGMLYKTDKATYHNYCNFYQENLKGLNPKTILEIGVKDGASLRMWKAFYPDARVIGLDINPPIDVFGCEVYKVDATNIPELMLFFREVGITEIDLIIDDGSHMTNDQQLSFMYLYPALLASGNEGGAGGIYIMEDIHTSKYPHFVNSEINTIDFIKAKPWDYQYKSFWNTEDKSDSGTMIIFKP